MSFERVARLAELAATDSGVLSALQNDPAQIRKPLQLSEDQLRALISAGSFTTGHPVRTTSAAEAPVGNALDVIALGTLGTLLPPEGGGAFPTPAELPPTPVAPKSVAPVPIAPSPQAAPLSAPLSAPVAPVVPVAPGAPRSVPAPASYSPQYATPAGPSSAPQSAVAPGSSSQTPVTPANGPVQASGSQQGSVTASSGTQKSAGQPGASSTTVPIQFMQAPGNLVISAPTMTVPGGCCGCDVGMISITAQVSASAQAALTAITALAGLN